MAPEFPRIQAAAIDGRMHNVFHRQEQLERLCKVLTDNVSEIKEAITSHASYSNQEVSVEYYLTLTAVKHHYTSLKPKEFHDEEYRIANGKDAADRRQPAGIVYVEPCTHTMFYSVIVPLAATLAAGNCVIVLLENNLHPVSGLLRRLLPSALDADVFAVASSPVKDTRLLDQAICILQRGIQDQPRINQLSHSSTSPVLAVVDRTADVNVAARELVAARFSFGGCSPYAPDVVLVNEFKKKDFLQAVVTECVQYGSGVEMNGHSKTKPGQGNAVHDQVEALKKKDSGVRTILQEPKFAVVDISSRRTVLDAKLDAPLLAVYGIKSLDDAIDLVSSKTQKPCLAAYHFGSPDAAKYLSQFVNAEVSFVNHIPRELLVGPAFTTGHTIDLGMRYPLDLLTVPRPTFVNQSNETKLLSSAMDGKQNTTSHRLLNDAASPLKELKRHPGGSMGFFEQGFLMNAGLILASTLTVSATGVFWLWRYSRPLL